MYKRQEEQKEVTALFHATLHLEGEEEAKKAVLETVCRLKKDSIAWKNENLAPTDPVSYTHLVPLLHLLRLWHNSVLKMPGFPALRNAF